MNVNDFGMFGGSLTADVLNLNLDAIPAPDTMFIHMTRSERRIADELRKQFGSFKRVVIDVDGERHEFGADSLIQLLEEYEDARDTSRYGELFGTPERAAEYIAMQCFGSDGSLCYYCPFDDCDGWLRNMGTYPSVRGKMLEWLRGDAE